jgi:hypothetical protein
MYEPCILEMETDGVKFVPKSMYCSLVGIMFAG